MKVKLSELNPNPFKKEINGGKLDKDVINKIRANIKELGLMGALPIFKKDGKFYLIAGHHRAEALRQEYGNNFEVEVIVHNYSEENILRGMIVENLTQRDNEFREEVENLVLIRKFLKASSPSEMARDKFHKGERYQAGVKEIAKWLNQKGEIMALGRISQILSIADNLNPELLEKVKKGKATSLDKQDEGILMTKDALAISRIEDKKEQKEIAELILNADIAKADERRDTITAYINAPEETKEKVLKGEIDISEVPIENLKSDIKKKIEEQKAKDKGKIVITHFKQYQSEAGNKIGRTNKEILETCSYLNGLDKSGVLLELDWKTMLKIIESGTGYGKNYTKFMERILTKIK